MSSVVAGNGRACPSAPLANVRKIMAMAYTAAGGSGEFALIDSLAKIVEPTLDAVPSLVKGIGDDCAVWRPSEGMVQVASTDLLVEHVHFDLLTTPAGHLGGKAIGVNVSDICAMNATPRYALVSIAVPQAYPVELLEGIYRGMAHAAEQYGVAIAGGDTSSSKSGLCISVTIVGEAPEEMLAYRKGARVGDLVCVTGTLGGAAAGLKVLLREKGIMLEHLENGETYNRNLMADLQEYSGAIQQQLLPVARLDMVRLFHAIGLTPTSMIDLSDGLSQDLGHLCQNSGTGARLQENKVPVNPAARQIADDLQEDAFTWALRGGEDYQLLFTLSREEYEAKLSAEGDITVIGEITPADEGLILKDIYGMQIDLTALGGFDHFS